MNQVELSGKYGFDIFLDIISDFDLLFIKQDYYNTGDFTYFFTTEKISKTYEILDTLKRKKSLRMAYLTLGKLKDLRLSFFFGIKINKLYYGFYNEDDRHIYKVGVYKVSSKEVYNLSKKPCMKSIRTILKSNNLKALDLLQEIKPEFENIFEGIESDVEIVDDDRIKNTFQIDIFNDNDRDENKLSLFLLKWSRKYPWTDKCYYFVRLTEKYAHFYIKVKPSQT